jgi:hypothetical protein
MKQNSGNYRDDMKVLGRGSLRVNPFAVYDSEEFQDALRKANEIVKAYRKRHNLLELYSKDGSQVY